MNKCITIEFEGDKGTTVISPNFFAIEEIVPSNSNIAEIEQGIEDEIYTPIDLNLYSFTCTVRKDFSQNIVATPTVLIDNKSTGAQGYNFAYFKILPSETNSWPNLSHKLIFDIKRTLLSDPDEVDIWVKGNINVNPVVTE